MYSYMLDYAKHNGTFLKTVELIRHLNIGIIFLCMGKMNVYGNDAYATLSQFWLAVQHSVKSTISWLVDVGK